MPTAATWITALGLWLTGHAVLALCERLGPQRPRGALERNGLALLLGLSVSPALLVACVGGAFDQDATRPLFALYLLGLLAVVHAALAERSRAAAPAAALALAARAMLYYKSGPGA